jgi:hypothetical protein
MFLLGLFFVFSFPAMAQEIITIQSTITGSQEQPKVINIVPWQKPEDPNYFGQDDLALGLMPNDFKPLNRDAFNKELQYISVMRKSAQK